MTAVSSIDVMNCVEPMGSIELATLHDGGAAVRILYPAGGGDNDCGAEPTGIELEK